MKIENKSFEVTRRGRSDNEFSEFLECIPKLKVGQSVLVRSPGSHYRLAVSIAKAWLKIDISTRTEDGGTRFARIA